MPRPRIETTCPRCVAQLAKERARNKRRKPKPVTVGESGPLPPPTEGSA